MLPMVQMQPCAMPRSANHDLYPSFRSAPSPLDNAPRTRDASSSFPRAFPIRSSQAHRRAALYSTSPYPPRSHDHLRRKPANGTFDGAFDGSSNPLALGALPSKHMILSPSSSNNSYGQAGMPYQHPPTWTPDSHVSNYTGSLESDTRPWAFNDNAMAQFRAQPAGTHGPLTYQSSLFGNPGSFSNMYQPVIRANEYNVRAFCPPPMPTSEGLPFGQPSWQPGPYLWDSQPTGQFAAIPPNMAATQYQFATADHGFEGSQVGGYNYRHESDAALNYRQPSSQLNMEALTLEATGARPTVDHHTSPPAVQLGFREKALAHAHKAYLDLLPHLQNGRKSQHSRTGSRAQGALKPFVYPKPPNPIPIASFGAGDAVFPSQSFSDHSDGSRRGQGVHFEPNRGYISRDISSNIHPSTAFSAGMDTGVFNMHRYPAIETAAQLGAFPGIRPENSTSAAPFHPLAAARSSLEVLHTLCEQSGWKWLDGILLGGCLHYGLENYDSALQWFSRILASNPSHVVAITDIAATLYCLGRQNEAEQHWLRAVKLNPGYLEAAEHLVGLLYRKRSKEAIEIIAFVQRNLRLSKPVPTHLSMAPGFGSSGYALPGSENGRILALVHAKGTMLYSLKEIEKAAEAFEEAVLISIGRRANGIHHLVRRIQTVLSPSRQPAESSQQYLQPLLLPPEKARQTARLVYSESGELPGLAFVSGDAPKRAANQTTSNSLLSLAKIFQDAMSSGASGPGVLRRSTGVGDILALYYLSLSLQESPSTANNVGILLAGVQQSVANTTATVEPTSQADIPGVPAGSGLALALAYYKYGLRLDPKHVHLHTNLGSLLKDIGQLDLAIQMYEQAVCCDGTFDIALTNLANAVKDRGRVKDAISYYRRAVQSNPDFAEAVCGLLTALNSVCDWRGRGGVILGSGQLDRWHVDSDGALVDSQASGEGSGLTKRVVDIVGQQLRDASRWGHNILQDDVIRSLSRQLANACDMPIEDISGWLRRWNGKPWEGSRLLRLIERAARVLLRKWYHNSDNVIASQSHYTRVQLPANLTVPSAPTVLPFHTFTCPLGPKDIRAISQRNALRISCSTLRSPWVPSRIYPPPSAPQPHLNIGYVSSDFNNHPLAHLMQSVFGFHDRRRARPICYATTASDNSAYRQKIETEAPVFRDVSSWSSDRLVRQILEDNIHILVNLNGYTRGARNEIFAVRPAPIQMSFMGFAGTIGAEWCDYILADTTAIPPSTLRPWRSNAGIEDVFYDESEGDADDWVYSENIIFCRDTFFCCDHAQSCDPSERQITWEQEQHRRWKMRSELFPSLPHDAIILGNFNQLYKIEPTTFRSWLRILAQIPKARLWLLRFPELGERNLTMTAKTWAGPEVASRLIFTDVAPKSQHISRARVCDLFLDTPECNAHTTAADVLWSSTPLLTYPRYSYKMCSRMAASILKGALPRTKVGQQIASELIAGNEAEYETMATTLAGGLSYDMCSAGYGKGRGRLADMRKLLWESKWQCALFDTRRWVSDVESAYEEAWRKWVQGEAGDIYL